jgi:hypothetical protein
MDEDVRGGEDVAHPLREPLDDHAPIRAEAANELVAHALVASREAEDGGARDLAGDLDGAGEVPHPPSSARDGDQAPLAGEPEAAARGEPRRRLVEGGGAEPPHGPDPAPRSHRAHLAGGLGMGDQMQVDARMGPEPEAGQVRDRGHHRRRHDPRRAQPPEGLGGRRIGGDDDVRPGSLDLPAGGRPGQPLDQRAGEAPRGSDLGDEPIGQVKEPASPSRVESRAAHDEPSSRPADDREEVDDLHLHPWRLGRQARGEHPRGSVVTLTDGGGQDQDAGGRLPEGCCRGSFEQDDDAPSLRSGS